MLSHLSLHRSSWGGYWLLQDILQSDLGWRAHGRLREVLTVAAQVPFVLAGFDQVSTLGTVKQEIREQLENEWW